MTLSIKFTLPNGDSLVIEANMNFMQKLTIAVLAFILLIENGCIPLTHAAPEDLIYGYECRENRCVRIELKEENFASAISLPVCRLFCGEKGAATLGTVWPQPTGPIRAESYLKSIILQRINIETPFAPKHWNVWEGLKKRFINELRTKLPVPHADTLDQNGHSVQVQVNYIGTTADIPKLTLDTDESYALSIAGRGEGDVSVNITAKSFYGARHGLETLMQLIVYDDIRRELTMPADVEIHDAPVFKWRGLLLDTSRNFYSIAAIKRTLDAMAMVKLNTFHWHITDSHSFPMELRSQPELYRLGAYSPRKVYSQKDITDVVAYGRMRGVRVMPEFDAPAHVGEGWQHKNMTACFGYQPWTSYCVEPPCGQLDPTVDGLYPVLEDIYREMFELFKPDVFHMGGDEVSVACWKSSDRIRKWMTENQQWQLEDSDFMRLWGHFQSQALKRVDNVAGDVKPPIILWTSHLTDTPYIDDYLDKERYIIQIWTKGNDPKVQDILKRGFHTIVSNYDALYFDCGGPGWVKDGNNWCSPFIGWQAVYDNRMENIGNKYSHLILGAEAAVWSEQIDEHTLDYRLWPRASALAERLWSNPTEGWADAEARLLFHRERLVENGIGAEAVQPEWCLQHENECPVNAYSSA